LLDGLVKGRNVIAKEKCSTLGRLLPERHFHTNLTQQAHSITSVTFIQRWLGQ
jgi:hypothetical protein